MKVVAIVALAGLTIISIWSRGWLPFKRWWEQDDEKTWREQEQDRVNRSRWEPKDW